MADWSQARSQTRRSQPIYTAAGLSIPSCLCVVAEHRYSYDDSGRSDYYSKNALRNTP